MLRQYISLSSPAPQKSPKMQAAPVNFAPGKSGTRKKDLAILELNVEASKIQIFDATKCGELVFAAISRQQKVLSR